jgi:hypothetical protein
MASSLMTNKLQPRNDVAAFPTLTSRKSSAQGYRIPGNSRATLALQTSFYHSPHTTFQTPVAKVAGSPQSAGQGQTACVTRRNSQADVRKARLEPQGDDATCGASAQASGDPYIIANDCWSDSLVTCHNNTMFRFAVAGSREWRLVLTGSDAGSYFT